MMKPKYIFYVFVILIFGIQNRADAQLKIIVDSVKLCGVVRIRPQNYCSEYFYRGPTLYTYFSFINESPVDSLILYPSKAKMEILYNYGNQKYQRRFSCFSYQEKKDSVLCLKPLQTMNYQGHNYLFPIDFLYGEKVNQDTIVDCTKNVIEILPTTRVSYTDGINSAVSSGIEKVIVGEIPVYCKPPKIFVE